MKYEKYENVKFSLSDNFVDYGVERIAAINLIYVKYVNHEMWIEIAGQFLGDFWW